VVELGVSLDEAAASLYGFRGIKRRQELRAEVAGVSIFDDFAHHPTAVRGSIAALRSRYPGRRIVAVFEARTNTSRRRVFQEAYGDALAGADLVVLPRVDEAPIYSATGEVTEFLAVDDLVSDLRSRGVDARAEDDVEGIVQSLALACRPGDVILVMSNGSFENIWERLEDALSV
jgi:UDP-N-acetylmuramate: L-alanyl-gamma-D-glutamyl-meso-diaminopimelate ligase